MLPQDLKRGVLSEDGVYNLMDRNKELLENVDGKPMSEIERLKTIVEKLRSEDGCPWDKAQTHESLKAGYIEEAAEVISGINIMEKTGDDNKK